MSTEYMHWISTPGPAKLCQDISNAITGKSTVWIPGILPWAEEFRETVVDTVSTEDSSINIELLDFETIGTAVTPVELIFELNPSAKQGYLPAMDFSRYVINQHVLERTVLWIYNIDGENKKQWIDLSRSLARLAAGLKIICEGAFHADPAKGVSIISVENCITKFDLLLYAMTMGQKNNSNFVLTMYACQLAVNLAEDAPEKIAELLAKFDRLIDEPEEYAAEVLPDKPGEAIKGAIRNAQTLAILPKAEEKRCELVDQLKDGLLSLLPFSDDFGNNITEPDEVELRHIVYYYNNNQLLLSDEEQAVLFMFYNVRNDVAHRKLIEGYRIRECLK